MHDKMIRQINGQIAEALLARQLSSVTSRKSADALLKHPDWLAGLDGLLPIRARLTRAQVLELCVPMLEKLAPQTPEQGWLAFAYQYICGCMFPGSGFVPGGER